MLSSAQLFRIEQPMVLLHVVCTSHGLAWLALRKGKDQRIIGLVHRVHSRAAEMIFLLLRHVCLHAQRLHPENLLLREEGPSSPLNPPSVSPPP